MSAPPCWPGGDLQDRPTGIQGLTPESSVMNVLTGNSKASRAREMNNRALVR